MAKGIGRRIQVGIAKESSRGTAESAATYYLPVAEATLDEKDSKVLDEQSIGVIEDSIGSVIAKQWVEGQIKGQIGDKSFPLILLAALGSLSSGSVSDSAYTHTITVQQGAQHQSLTFFIDDPIGAQDYKYALGVIDSLEINAALGQFVTFTANVRSKKGATATLSPSVSVENKFLAKHVTLKLASDLSGLGAASAISIKGLSLKITKNVEDDDVLGSATPADFLNKQLMIEGTIEAMWQGDSDFRTAFMANTAKAVRITLTSDTLIGSTSVPKITIDLAKVSFMELTRPIVLNDMVKQTVQFRAHYSTGDSKMITIDAINAVSSY